MAPLRCKLQPGVDHICHFCQIIWSMLQNPLGQCHAIGNFVILNAAAREVIEDAFEYICSMHVLHPSISRSFCFTYFPLIILLVGAVVLKPMLHFLGCYWRIPESLYL